VETACYRRRSSFGARRLGVGSPSGRVHTYSAGQASTGDVLRLAAGAYEGLPARDIEEISEMARHRAFRAQ